MSSPVAVPLEAESAEPMSFGARLVGILLSPVSTFADIVRKPGWLAPLLVLVGAGVLVSESMLWKIGMERIVRMGLEQNPRAAQMTPEQAEAAVAQGVKFGSFLMHVTPLVAAPVFMLIVAGLGLLILNSLFGQELKFKTAYSVSCYAGLPGVLGALMAVALILLGDPNRFTAGNPAPTNLGFFLNPLETAKPLYTLATSMDIFTVWFLILLGIGFSVATGRRVKAVTVFGCYAGLWLAWVLIKVGMAAL